MISNLVIQLLYLLKNSMLTISYFKIMVKLLYDNEAKLSFFLYFSYLYMVQLYSRKHNITLKTKADLVN